MLPNFFVFILAQNERECLMILCLNDANRLVHHDTVIEGTVNRAPFYPREVIKTALMHNATGLIMVHNHPSGDPTPSENDHRITNMMDELGKEFNIKFHDHLIVTPRNAFSLKTGKLLSAISVSSLRLGLCSLNSESLQKEIYISILILLLLN